MRPSAVQQDTFPSQDVIGLCERFCLVTELTKMGIEGSQGTGL